MLERERPLDVGSGKAREPLGSRDAQYASTSPEMRSSSLLANLRIPLTYRRRRAPRARAPPGLRAARARAGGGRHPRARSPRGSAPRRPSPSARPPAEGKPEHALGEVPVRAALEQGERAVREPAHVVQRRRGDLRERRQLDADAELTGRKVGEQRQLAARLECLLGLGRRLARNVRAIDGEHEARLVALDLERIARPTLPRAREPRDARAPSRSASRDRPLRSGSIAPDTISRSIARVIAT